MVASSSVVAVLPYLEMAPQVNQDCALLASLIHDKLKAYTVMNSTLASLYPSHAAKSNAKIIGLIHGNLGGL